MHNKKHMQMFSSFLQELFIFFFFFAKSTCTTVFRFLLMPSGFSAQFWHFGLRFPGLGHNQNPGTPAQIEPDGPDARKL